MDDYQIMWPFNQNRVLLGEENDDALLEKLGSILESMNATHIKSKQYVVGSQDISIDFFKIGRHRLKVINETYAGLIIKGHKHLISVVAQKIKE